MKNISRRTFFKKSVKATAATVVGSAWALNSQHAVAQSRDDEGGSTPLEFKQVKLPYAYNALEPHIDAMTMDIHYNKHYGTYVKNINEAIAAEHITYTTEEDFFANASKLSAKARNNGGGSWNHAFFWEIMKPGAGAPGGKVKDAINGAFGSMEEFKKQFGAAAAGRFGSGWAWLVKEGGKLKIGSTPNQDNPLMDLSELKGTPVLGLDVWEHAYYLKYQNKRPDYVTNWWNVVNWDEVAKKI